jgi:hypothetical protein
MQQHAAAWYANKIHAKSMLNAALMQLTMPQLHRHQCAQQLHIHNIRSGRDCQLLFYQIKRL